MKFAIAKEHKDFYQKQGWIEFEGLVSPDQLALFNHAIDLALAERLHATPERLNLLSSEQLYLQGRDLWRSNLSLRKWATQARFAEIASELVEKKPLRLGYDQLLPALHHTPFAESNAQVYSHFLTQTLDLASVSCLHGIVCGLIFALGEKQGEQEKKDLASGDIFPLQPGHATFFQPHFEVQWQHLAAHHLGQRFYLIVYTQPSAYYQLQPQDPHTHALKRLGYIFNDKLSDKFHPIVYR